MVQETVQKHGVSRRSFLKGVGAVAGAAVIGLPSLQKALAQALPTSFGSLPKDTLLKMYTGMQRIRQLDNQIGVIQTADNQLPIGTQANGFEGGRKLQPGSSFPWEHTSIGEEAVNVGVATAMQPGDLLVGTYRCHGYAAALGMDMKALFAELYGRVTGINRGHGGSMTLNDPSIGLLAVTGIVGAGVPHGVGVAKALKLQGKKNVAIAAFGDGATKAGNFASALNLAQIWQVPVVFVIHNNQFQTSVKAAWEDSLSRAGKDLSVRAVAYDMPGVTVDGMDVFAVYNAASQLIEQARANNTPALLECVTYRFLGHSHALSKHEVLNWPYSDPAELDYWMRRDPITRFENVVLAQEGVLTQAPAGLLAQADLDAVKQQVAAEIAAAVDFADKSEKPDPKVEYKHFADVFGVSLP